MTESICPECSKPFVPRDFRQKCCSRDCGINQYEKTPARRLQARDQYRKHIGKRKAYQDAKYANSNERAKIIAYMRHRREQNPERIQEINAKSRARPEARKRAALVSKIWRKEKRMNQPWKLTLQAAKKRAKLKNLPFDLTDEWAAIRWTGRCEISDISFTYGNLQEQRSPSLDRIIPSLGYVQSNSRFILWSVNAFKGQFSDAEMFAVAKAIAHRHEIEIVEVLSLPG